MLSLSKKTYYTNDNIPYLINTYIREYDLRKAGQSALLVAGCIDRKQYEYLCSLPREQRQIQTGLLLRDNPYFVEASKSTIAKARESFVEANGLRDWDILSVKNDAIYVIAKQPVVTSFADGILEFVSKNVYTSYYRYFRTEMYYFYNAITNEETIDIKNIGDNKLALHREFMLDFLMYLFNMAQTSDIKQVISTITGMIDQYVNLQLPLGYYREFNALSQYRFNISEWTTYQAEFLPEDMDKSMLDIGQNLDLLRYLAKIYSEVYFTN